MSPPVVLPYEPISDERRDECFRSAVALARGVLSVAGQVRPARFNKALAQAVWEVTEAEAKYGCRYRSIGALAEGAVPEHEHVIPVATIRMRLLAAPDQVESILATAVSCLVTHEEHQRLSRVDPSIEGWQRYVHEGIAVWDAADGRWLLSPTM